VPTGRPVERDDLVEALRNLADALRRPPTKSEINEMGKYSYSAYYEEFGSLDEALEAAGLTPRSQKIPRDDLVDELHRLGGKLQETPRVRDLKEKGRYSYTVYRNEFGSWNEALKTAGFTPNQRGTSREDLIDELHRLGEKLDSTPRKRDLKEHSQYSYWSYRNEFGTWNNSLLEAGFEPNVSKIPREDLLEALDDLAERLGRIPRIQDMRRKGRYSPSGYRNEFDSWNNALRAGGFRLNQEHGIDDRKLLAEIDRLATGDEPPTSDEIREKGDYCISTYVRAFDSWNNALREAGYEPHVEREDTREKDGSREDSNERVPDPDAERYGPDWMDTSYEIREKDGGCFSCGVTQEELEKYGESLSVHHVTTDKRLQKRDENSDEDEGDEDFPAKLVTLCPECHRKWEKIGIGPDVRVDRDESRDGGE